MTYTPHRPLVLVGAGKMGGAMLAGWIQKGVNPKSVFVVDPSPAPEIADLMSREGIAGGEAMPADMRPAILMLAVKPQMMDAVLPNLVHNTAADTLVLSVAAGTTIERFSSVFGDVPIVRVMPNTPAQVGRGMNVACANARVGKGQKDDVTTLLSAIGKVAWVDDEAQMDAVTAVSGSGPAYVFYLTEALAQAGVRAGLPEDLANTIARQTVVGAGELMHQSDLDASTLRENVTSPNGTTAAALAVLMAENGLQPLMDRAVEAAAKRSRDLAG
ncbi:pyrroline-5-carboxylate reductase [Rhizobiales bacterium]|uniref:pyrroline-5-carboxylate reductase n=1 Tax=Hongsoonwoonella zoysiae TaxID=2821844 RepID=UPI0015612D7B|nr:pyrroline-5-carboxylate reductase [Hongsoonwoonella zoysiae]NRG17649.1 pyrroline-5-carboxylate reductase [Hongsoonwoonella zoysiae]